MTQAEFGTSSSEQEYQLMELSDSQSESSQIEEPSEQ